MVQSKKCLRYILGVSMSVALSASLTACKPKPADAVPEEDILTQTVIPEGKTPVTILVKYAFSINTFEKAVEEKFSDIDIIQVGNYTSDMGVAEYNRRLRHDDLTDIVMTWPLEVGEEYWQDRLLDLSALPDTSKYNVSMLNTIAREGKLYYLPGPSQVRGIVYNKTLFTERGWSVPQNFEEFTELCETIEASGMRSIQLGFGNTEVLDTAFIGYSYGDCYSKPADAQWMSDYNEGKGSIGDQLGPALDTFQSFIDKGIWKKEDLELYYQDRERMLFNRECAMVEDSVLLARMGYEFNGSTDEFALMPFFTPGEEGDWARLYPVCYIGFNKHLADPEQKEKYDVVMRLLNYISTPEGQEALMGDTGAMFSSLQGVQPPNIPEIYDLVPALTHGRFAIFSTLENAQGALRRGLAGMVSGELTKEDVIQMTDAENTNPPVQDMPSVLGTATADFTLLETGNFVTDALRAAGETEIALFMDNGKDGKYNGKGISGRLYKGEITMVDVGCVMPDIKHGESGILQKVRMTGENLIKTLESSILVDNNIGGWFYYFSGLRMEYSPTAEPGSRIKTITDANGEKIDPEKVYTIAAMDGTFPEEYALTVEFTNMKISDIIADAIRAQKTITPSGDGRFTVARP